jgi:hypothetical protein
MICRGMTVLPVSASVNAPRQDRRVSAAIDVARDEHHLQRDRADERPRANPSEAEDQRDVQRDVQDASWVSVLSGSR